MKKIIYSLLILVSIFFVIDKVSATADNTNVVYFDIEHSTFTTALSTMQSKIDEIIEYYESNNPYNHQIVIWIGKDSSGAFAFVNLLPSDFTPNTASEDYSFCNIQAYNYGSSYYYNSGGCQTDGIGTKKYTFRSTTSLSTFKSDMQTVYSSISGKSSGSMQLQNSSLSAFSFTNNQYDFFSTNTKFILPYYSTTNIYNYSLGSMYYYKIKIGENELPFNSNNYLEPSKNYFQTDEPEPYTFDEYIEDYNYAKMIFNFDLSVLESRENVFDIWLQNFSIENKINDTILYETERFEISYPYLEYETSTGLKDILYLKDTSGNDIKDKRKVFYGNYVDTLPEDVTSLKLIIPLYDTSEYQLLVQFVSWFPFEVTYETDEEFNSYYEYLILENKYGVVFMPKLVENNSHITTYFLTRGMESVYVYDGYDYKQDPIAVYTDISDFTYSFTYDEQDNNLFFKIRSSSSTANVYYDTRYFDYYIIDSKYSVGNITNPNDNESNYIDFSNTANVSIDFESIGDIFYFISEKLDSDGQAYFLFSKSVSTFFDTMPTDIYIFILTLLAVILIGTVLALGGWK